MNQDIYLLPASVPKVGIAVDAFLGNNNQHSKVEGVPGMGDRVCAQRTPQEGNPPLVELRPRKLLETSGLSSSCPVQSNNVYGSLHFGKNTSATMRYFERGSSLELALFLSFRIVCLSLNTLPSPNLSAFPISFFPSAIFCSLPVFAAAASTSVWADSQLDCPSTTIIPPFSLLLNMYFCSSVKSKVLRVSTSSLATLKSERIFDRPWARRQRTCSSDRANSHIATCLMRPVKPSTSSMQDFSSPNLFKQASLGIVTVAVLEWSTKTVICRTSSFGPSSFPLLVFLSSLLLIFAMSHTIVILIHLSAVVSSFSSSSSFFSLSKALSPFSSVRSFSFPSSPAP
mmetsp:Transcript_32965/g.55983  ORF Transcript_32965/g.55983 Transcript_32965/m.55983 type:complete len:342 (-) Transcript_32965:301-1326(-)